MYVFKYRYINKIDFINNCFIKHKCIPILYIYPQQRV